jgi:hypothetical protein
MSGGGVVVGVCPARLVVLFGSFLVLCQVFWLLYVDIYRYIVLMSHNMYSATLKKVKSLYVWLVFCLVCVCFLFGFACVWLGWVGMGGEKTDHPRSI